ncbi:hypothetical protein BGZ63DRAFT_453827 [Mariannaea sp. PMI_226]|nr:hypothetical protein BGZ63DRAFT_453827 [Mariannaea sp. PMI_226]
MEDRPPSPPRRLRACAPCTKVKARCHFKGENVARHLCERCDRMGIECSERKTQILRKSRQIKMASRGGPTEHQAILRPDDGMVNPAVEDQPSRRSDSQCPGAPVTMVRSEGPEVTQNRQYLQSDLAESRHPLGLSWNQVARVLVIFRSKYLPVFPFLTVDEKAGPLQLHSERPFLLRAIILIAAPLSVPRIAKMKRNVLAYMSQQVFLEEKKTLDLLQGILVCIAWAYTCQISDEQVTNLSHFALGYAHNLGLTKIPRQMNSSSGIKDSEKERSSGTTEAGHSSEEQRALLGLFCIHSVTSAHSPRSNPIDSLYPEMCRVALSEASPSSPPDLFLDRLVRMVQMGEKLSLGFGEPHERDQSRSYVFLLEGRGRRFRTELNRLIEFTAHPELAERQPLFRRYLQYIIVRLYEPAVTVIDRPEDGVPPSRYRCLCLRNCLDAVQEFLELVTSAPPDDFFLHQTIITAHQASFVMAMGARLLLIDAPDWDISIARQRLDLRSYLDKVLACVNEAEELRSKAVKAFAEETALHITDEEREAEGNLAETARKIRWLREWFEARLQGRPAEMEIFPVGIPSRQSSSGAWNGGDGVMWYNGMLENASWNFDP